ncbi:MAG TPA: dimethylamine monooxygenase subunit DmmA family protein, partial [Burkholderiales bacterium]|nr:dimethylamine monooxygenase subunit DmmA family protein [Burkholderiales bacterium]
RPLAWDADGRSHLLAGHGSAGARLLQLLAARPQADVAVCYASESMDDADYGASLRQAIPAAYAGFTAIDDLLQALHMQLGAARMGLRLYLGGPEDFLWAATRVAFELGLSRDEIQSEHCGSSARTVYCVHCKNLARGVTTNIVVCGVCSKTLGVRDHYSRRLAAYMGVQIDAEAPGALPAIEHIYA